VTWEAVQRLSGPVEEPGLTVMLVALVGIGIGIGIGVNTGSALLFMSACKGDLHAKGAYLHMAADLAVLGAVVLAAAGILFAGRDWLDPAVAMAVSLLIAVTAAGLFREALHLSLDGVPFEIDRTAVADWPGRQDGVHSLHDLHISPLSTTRTALAVHLVCEGPDPDAFIDKVTNTLADRHGIANVTLQLERQPCYGAAAGLAL
jgi:cobalt-zinc-cadmium efflux system protein